MTYKDFMIRFFLDLVVLAGFSFLLVLIIKPTFAVMFAVVIMFLADYIYCVAKGKAWVPGGQTREEKQQEREEMKRKMELQKK